MSYLLNIHFPILFQGPGVPKLPAVNYRPMVPLKHWTDLRRNKVSVDFLYFIKML